MDQRLPESSLPTTTVAAIAGAIVAVVAVVDAVTPGALNPTAGYCVGVAVCAWGRSRRLVWAVALVAAALAFVELPLRDPNVELRAWRLANRAIAAFGMVATGLVVHLLIGAMRREEHRRAELAAQNEELAGREEEIARQNEELQSQTEELERQGEELRVTNDELARRERALQALLDLSRTLTAGLSEGETMGRICAALTLLIGSGEGNGAAAITERVGDAVRVRCHSGFGDGGLVRDAWPYQRSFTHLVLEKNQTGFLEDMRLRPDLEFPAGRGRPPMRSVLAAPLRVRGRAVGSIEAYAPERQSWTEDQIALIESLAAQASISLESAALFEEIERHRRRMETVFQTLPIGVLVADAGTQAIRVNAAGAALLNLPTDADLAAPGVRHWEVRRNGVPVPPDQTAVRRALSHGDVVHGDETELIFRDGRRLSVLVSAAPIRDRDGSTLGAVAAFTDVTQLKDLQRELETRRREAEEASVRKTRFLAAVSHDIRTPANAISLMAELIRRAAHDPAMATQIPQMAGELQGSARTMVELVSDVLDVARFDSGKVELLETEFPLAAVVVDEARQLLPLAQEKKLALEFDLPQPPVWLRADRVKLGRILANLVGNAIKFTPAGAVRVCASHAPDGGVDVCVADTGVGIPSEHLTRIFDEFYQLRNPERDRNKGSGLGLAICKRLVDAMGGRIDVTSSVGQGSSFTIRLPASCVIHRPPGGAEPAVNGLVGAPPRAADGDGLRGRRVLIVEDHEGTRTATARLLQQEGAVALQAPTGRDALRMLREHDPEILLLDLMLPDMQGQDILTALRDGRPASLRHVLVLTGDLVSTPREDLLKLGVDGVCSKPVEVDSLIRLLRRGNG